MSFGGPPPTSLPPSGPFEAKLAAIASSPYTLAGAIFMLNMGGRLLPFELSKGQEKFLNQAWFRRFVIFVIFFVATRNIITAGWLAFLIILSIGYLFNENSSLYLFGDHKTSDVSGQASLGQPIAGLTPEETMILKSLNDKSERHKVGAAPQEKPSSKPINLHKKYEDVISKLWSS